jgi:hypothetical protein
MKTIDFIDSESQRIKNLDNDNKALSLIQSVNVEIGSNSSFNVPLVLKNTISTVNFMNQAAYLQELRITRYLLEYYRDNTSFDVTAIPFPQNKEIIEKFNTIKKRLQLIFKE